MGAVDSIWNQTELICLQTSVQQPQWLLRVYVIARRERSIFFVKVKAIFRCVSYVLRYIKHSAQLRRDSMWSEEIILSYSPMARVIWRRVHWKLTFEIKLLVLGVLIKRTFSSKKEKKKQMNRHSKYSRGWKKKASYIDTVALESCSLHIARSAEQNRCICHVNLALSSRPQRCNFSPTALINKS